MANDVSHSISEFFSQYPLRTYPKGHILLFPGQNPEHLFYLQSVKVRKYSISYRGDEMIVNIFGPPTFFPMPWMLNHTTNHYYYKTEEPTEARLAPTDATLRFVEGNADVALDLLRRLYRNMDDVLGRVLHLMSASAKSRILYELILECRGYGQQRDDGVWVGLHETDLAARAGLSRETVSRELRQIKAAGLVVVSRDGLLVRDLPAVERMLGGVI